MSDDDSDIDENDCVNSIKNLRKRLSDILHEIDDIVYIIQESEPLFTRIFPVNGYAIGFLKMETASLSDILNHLMPKWKKEGRILKGGKYVILGKEAKLMKLKPETEVNIYDLCNHMMEMLNTNNLLEE
jgi:hypothetical protein